MPDRFKLTIAQLNPTVGDLDGNMAKAVTAHQIADQAGSDFLALPEMFMTGYQIQDLAIKPAFVADVWHHMQQLADNCSAGPALGIGGPALVDGRIYNAYFILQNGEIAAQILKHHLPNTHVFDERRVYAHGPVSGPVNIAGTRIGLPICEDAWHEDVCEALQESGAEILIVPNGSPYYRQKFDRRMSHMVARVVETGLPLVYLNMVGGQDDQVFDGGSFVLNPGGALALQLPLFDEAISHVTFQRSNAGWRAIPGEKASHPVQAEQDYRVVVEGLRDYMAKTGFQKVLLGLSGGVDSAMVATIAADALGAENLRCVMMPSEYTSEESLSDAAEVAQTLGCHLDNLPISQGRQAILETLAPLFDGLEEDLTEENIQSRLRGLLLMALSNKFGEMLLTTGNKSEVAVGYATIYGDMAGGYNPIKDMYKMRVFAACRWRNEHHRAWMKGPKGIVIPPRVIEKPPTAELRENQRDDDSLPPYEILDGILELLIEGDASVADCVAAGYDRDTVKRVEHLIYISEYKRFQSAPGARLTGRAFWLDRRYPIANVWRDKS